MISLCPKWLHLLEANVLIVRQYCCLFVCLSYFMLIFSRKTMLGTLYNFCVTLAVCGLLILGNNAAKQSKCPCADESLCQAPIGPDAKRKEVFVFALSTDNWKLYDWRKITTIVMVGFYDAQLMCHAHMNNARAVKISNFPFKNLTDDQAITDWVAKEWNYVNENFLDGINIDFEDPIPKDNTSLRFALRKVVGLSYVYFKEANESYQVTFDIAWSPDCIDGRCYDTIPFSKLTDFLFVMAYDEQSQIFGPDCVAGPNSGLNKTSGGLKRFLDLGVDPSKLVLGVPWYGYKYSCINRTQTKDHDICYIKHVPFRGVQCSDAAGSQINYKEIMEKYLPNSKSGRQWDNIAKSPYFDYQDPASKTWSQFWYDDPESLKHKFQLAESLGLRGVGMWQADALDYSDTPEGKKQRDEMWGALPSYKKLGQRNKRLAIH